VELLHKILHQSSVEAQKGATESRVPWRKSAGNSSLNLDHGSSAGFWFHSEDHAALSLLQLLLSEGGCAHVRSVYEHLL